jgi:hypothetical protein
MIEVQLGVLHTISFNAERFFILNTGRLALSPLFAEKGYILGNKLARSVALKVTFLKTTEI